MLELNAENVTAMVQGCLGQQGDEMKCVVHCYIFDPTKVAEAKPRIAELLSQLDDTFMATKGGGMSFLHLCYDRNGTLWTGLHLTMEGLVALGMAAGLVSFPMTRDYWPALPGGMPYVTIDDTKIAIELQQVRQ